MIKVRKLNTARVCQGDIFSEVEHIESVKSRGSSLEVSTVIFPLIIVLTQDCDLEQDYRVRWSRAETPDQDKKLVSVLVAPLYNLEHMRVGEHLSDLNQPMQKLNSEKVKLIRSNQSARYHFLEFPPDIPIVPSVIDFKHYFSVNVSYLKQLKSQHFVCKVAEIYREDLSQRFASYLSRIGLP